MRRCGFRLGHSLVSLAGLAFPGFFGWFFGHFVRDCGALLGALNSGLVNLRRRLLRVDHLVTLDGTHTADCLGVLPVRGFFSWLHGFFLGGLTGLFGFLTGIFGR